MRHDIRMVLGALALLITANALSNEPADAEPPAMKPGWTDAQLNSFSSGCVAAILSSAKRDYAAAAEKAGNQAPKPFPEDQVKASVQPMCSCLGNRIARTWPFDEFMQHQSEYSQPLIQEAVQGGRCKPEGILGKMLEGKSAPPPSH